MKNITIGKKYRGKRIKSYLRIEGRLLKDMPIGTSVLCENTPEGLLLKPVRTN